MNAYRAFPFLFAVTLACTPSGEVEPVPLDDAGNLVILSKAGISVVPLGASITGDIGVSPAFATSITDFALVADSTNTFSTSALVSGRVYAADHEPPTPENLTAAVGAMEDAYDDAAGRESYYAEYGNGELGGQQLRPGVYSFSTSVGISSDVTLTGNESDVWIFQIDGDFTVSTGVQVDLRRDARAENVFWQVAGTVELGTASHLEGIVLGKTDINLRTGASAHGRLLSQTAVTLDGNVVTEP